MPKAKYADRKKSTRKAPPARSSMNAKRRAKVDGKKKRKGESGPITDFITRTRAVKRLGITLRDFRRLCILKGIYPRVPTGKRTHAHNSNAYYHMKDISYLAHEPLLAKFREFKAFMKKVKRAIGRKEIEEARRMYADAPQYGLDHLIKERYPSFTDALGDLDDALNMSHLFAAMPAVGSIHPRRTALAARLSREWQFYVARSRSLRKVFLSIKGVYFQAVVRGVTVTWLQPWTFVPNTDTDADYRVMLTFLEFHEVLLQFVMYKLYHSAGLAYPPRIRKDLEEAGLFLPSVAVAPAGTAGTAAATADGHAPASAVNATVQSRVMQLAKLPGMTDAISAATPVSASAESLYEHVRAADEADDPDADAALAAAEPAIAEQMRKERAFSRLFRGLVFFLGREVPRAMFEFIIVCFGGQVGWDGPGSPFGVDDARITHQIVDRPVNPAHPTARVAGRELAQPQWIVDSINAHLMLPTTRYAQGAVLPPHLSPFTDDYKEGYIPSYRQELDKLRAAAAVTGSLADVMTEAQVAAAAAYRAPVDDADAEEESGDESEDDEEDGGDESGDGADGALEAAAAHPRKKAREDSRAAEHRALAESMLSSKKKRLYDRVTAAVQHKKRETETLMQKRRAAEASSRKSGGEAAPAAGSKRRRD